MAEDIMISVSLEVEQALQDLGNLENTVQTATAGLGNNLSPQVNNLGTRLQSAGGKITSFGQRINDFVGNQAVQAFKRAGDAAKGFATECVQASIKSETEWRRYGALVNSNGGNWAEEEDKVRKWASTFSNQMGRANGDTREAMMTLAQMGVKSSEMETSMKGVAAVAARTGMTEAEASNVVASALNGRGMQLAKLTGLRIEDYKNADGQIDKERLMNDLYNQNIDAIDAYANTTEAQVNRMNNSWGKFKKDIGDALMPVVKIVADVMGAVAKWFGDLPGPVKTFIAALLAVGAVIGTVIGALAFIGPVLVRIGGVITAIGEAGSIIAFLTPMLGGLSAGFGVLAGAIAPLILPILAVVAALTALYFIGVQMGWWNDLSGMISKFGEVLGVAVGYIMNFVSWFARLFTDFPAAQEEFRNFVDNLGNIILDGLGALGGMIWDALQSAFSNINLNDLLMIFFPLPMLIYQALQAIGPYVMQAFSNLQMVARMAVSGVINAIVQRFMSVVMGVRNVFMLVTQAIRTRLNQARAVAGSLATMIRQVIVTRIQAVVARVRSFFTQIVSTIRSRLANAVSTARSQALAIYNGIKNKIAEIPQAVADEFNKIKDKISNALDNAKNVAVSKISDLVAAVKSALGIASPGFIQRMVTSEFNAIPGIIDEQGVEATRSATRAASSIVGAFDQFNAFNPLNTVSEAVGGSMDMNVLAGNMAGQYGGIANTATTTTNNSTTNNDDHTVINNYNTFNLSELNGRDKEWLYNMLDTVYPGGV